MMESGLLHRAGGFQEEDSRASRSHQATTSINSLQTHTRWDLSNGIRGWAAGGEFRQTTELTNLPCSVFLIRGPPALLQFQADSSTVLLIQVSFYSGFGTPLTLGGGLWAPKSV
jgi:hypothetical protein